MPFWCIQSNLVEFAVKFKYCYSSCCPFWSFPTLESISVFQALATLFLSSFCFTLCAFGCWEKLRPIILEGRHILGSWRSLGSLLAAAGNGTAPAWPPARAESCYRPSGFMNPASSLFWHPVDFLLLFISHWGVCMCDFAPRKVCSGTFFQMSVDAKCSYLKVD